MEWRNRGSRLSKTSDSVQHEKLIELPLIKKSKVLQSQAGSRNGPPAGELPFRQLIPMRQPVGDVLPRRLHGRGGTHHSQQPPVLVQTYKIAHFGGPLRSAQKDVDIVLDGEGIATRCFEMHDSMGLRDSDRFAARTPAVHTDSFCKIGDSQSSRLAVFSCSGHEYLLYR